MRFLAKSGSVDKFVSFRPKQQFLRVEASLPESEGASLRQSASI